MKKLKIWSSSNLSIILAIFLYALIYYVRFQQGGWEPKLDLFPQIRESLDKRISQLLPSPRAELLSGILLGNNKDLPHDLRLALRDTSTLHIVVVSGQNLTLLAGVFLGLSGLIKRKNAIILSLLAVIFYTMLTGAQIPVLRAAIMATISLLAQIYGRQRDGIWALLVTGGLMLLINPLWLMDLSFQLSFLATLGLIVVAPVVERIFRFLPDFLRLDLGVTIGAQLMVMPIIIQNFHQLSLVSVFANLLIGWTVPFIMILGTAMLLLSFLGQFLGQLVAFWTNTLLTYFIYIVQFFSVLPFAWEYIGEQIWIVWVGYYLVLGGILLGINKLTKKDVIPSEL